MLSRRVRAIVVLVIVIALQWSSLDPALAGGEDTDNGGSTSVTSPEAGSFVGRTRVSGKRVSPSIRGSSRSPSRPGSTSTSDKPRLTKEQWAAFLAMCKQTYSDSGCRELPVSVKLDPAVMIADLDAIARSLVVRLQLPDPTPQIGPDPEVNEWKMVAVGYPLWLWTRGPATVTTTARAYGVSFTLQATWLSTSFDMGDGHRVTCSSTAVYDRSVRPGAESPSCGYRYETSSLPRGNYSVTATTNWRITWRALGQSGSLPGSYSGTRSLPVGELNALVVR